ncbi:hypothetical protein RB595_005873 [Gaeumannomyces hyphopodioides]
MRIAPAILGSSQDKDSIACVSQSPDPPHFLHCPTRSESTLQFSHSVQAPKWLLSSTRRPKMARRIPPNSSPETREPLLGSHTNSVAFGPASTFTPVDTRDASVINDFGDNKQLEFISQRSDGPFDHGHLVAGVGNNFTNTWDGLGPSAFPTQLDVVESQPVRWEGYPSVPEDFHKTLHDRILDLLVDPQWPHNKPLKEFLPFNKLGELITMETVEKELIFHGIGPAHASELSAKIVDISSPVAPQPSIYEKTTRRKLFTILVIMEKVPAILDFIQEGLLDKDLPFVYDPATGKLPNRRLRSFSPTLCRKPPGGGDAPLVPVESMRLWKAMEIEYFHSNQWTMLAPFLQLSNQETPKVHHYPLDYHSILPFVAIEGPDDASHNGLKEMREFTGGFSEVHKIQIHPHHHNLYDPTAPELEKNPFFALKMLREGARKEAFDQEVNCLKRLMDENSPSLVRLLGTFEHSGHYYLIFPWAEANLEQFMAHEYPDPDCPPRDASLARWVSKQLASLAGGLKLVHSSPIRKNNKQEMQPVSKKIYGRHGDIKPANILFFRSRDPQPDEGSNLGIFKIADFGFTEFHSLDSVEVAARGVGRSPTHKAPECDGTSVSPSSDFWSLGAVMLELMVWYIRGHEGHNAFSQRRRDDDQTLFRQPAQDKYFNIKFGANNEVAEVKESVRKEIANLRSHERCSAFVHDVVDFIEKRLLVVDPQHRANTDELHEAMNRISKGCIDSEVYCSTPTVGRYHPACQVVDEPCSSPGSDSDMTTGTSPPSDDSTFTHKATLTRETTALGDSRLRAKKILDIPPQGPRSLADFPGKIAELSIPVEMENQGPSSRPIARQASGRVSRPGGGGLGRKNSWQTNGQDSTSAGRQSTLKSGNQSSQETRAPQAANTDTQAAAGPTKRALRKQDAPRSGGIGTRSKEARIASPVIERKRKAPDWPVADKILRRSTG